MFTWIAQLIDQFGYAGVAVLMFLESAFPPIPSEVIMAFAGFNSARGGMNFVLVVVSGSIGSLAGATLWYFVGRWISEERLKRWTRRHGRLLALHPADVDRVNAWFDRHDELAVLIGRLVVPIHTLISVPAGLFRMPLRRFLVFSGIGIALWTTLLAAAGYLLGEQYRLVQDYIDPVSQVVLGAILLLYLYRVVTWKPD